MPNRYQIRKARIVAGSLIHAACQSEFPLAQLATSVAGFSEAQWRSISFANGQAVLDTAARRYCVALLWENLK